MNGVSYKHGYFKLWFAHYHSCTPDSKWQKAPMCFLQLLCVCMFVLCGALLSMELWAGNLLAQVSEGYWQRRFMNSRVTESFLKALGKPTHVAQSAFTDDLWRQAQMWHPSTQEERCRRACSLKVWVEERAVDVGMGGSKDKGKVIWRYDGSWEGFHKNKLSTRIVIVHMDISRFKAYGMFHGLFFLYQYLSRILQITWFLS